MAWLRLKPLCDQMGMRNAIGIPPQWWTWKKCVCRSNSYNNNILASPGWSILRRRRCAVAAAAAGRGAADIKPKNVRMQ